ncbi:hypothetical protein HRbin04_00491 [archaeon HR04]|nr:hypothetical protein HRbin04_00491 [archaeon HR04]
MQIKKNRDVKATFMIRLPEHPILKLPQQGLRYKVNTHIRPYILEMGLFTSIIYLLII